MISFIKGWFAYLFLRRSQKAKDRLAICDDCEFRKGFVCGECGCVLVAKAESDDECPKGYWPVLNWHQESLHRGGMRQWKHWECRIMNLIDFRFWFCECHYMAPYGKVISADCAKHD